MKKLTLAILFISVTAFPCQFDTDCSPGSSCIKQGINIYGFCEGGLRPGNSNDNARARNPLNPTQGNTCQFNTDCEPGNTCVKGSFNIYGTCK